MRDRLLVLLCAITATGCGGGDDAADDDAVDDAGGDPGDGGGGGGPDAGPPLQVCTPGCVQAADCATGAAGTIVDADNYACTDGLCVWRGCLSTAECTTTFSDPDYVCEQAFGATVPQCWPTCASVGDCTLASTLYDADNYECSGGKCHWTGCTSTVECTSALSNPDYVCADRGGGFANCWPTCTTPADCATASAPYDADNYACDDGVCQWTGCNSTGECMSVDPDWVCR